MMNAIQTDLQVLVERDVPVPVRDGTLLSADVYHRRSAGPWPVIVERSPYHQPERVEVDADLFVRNGYVYVFQHVRGRFRSRGAFRPLRDDGWGTNQDGFDTIAWAARQPWSNGAVAMFGGSYAGYTQYLAAPTRPPALRALLIRQGPSDLYGDLVYRGGAHQLFVTREWGLRAILLQQLEHETAALGSEPRREAAQVANQQLDDWFRRLPLRSFPPFEGGCDWYFEWLDHPEDGPYWEDVNATPKLIEVCAPALHLGGWFDPFLGSTLRCFTGLRQHGLTETARAGQRLIVGPWVHWSPGVSRRRAGEVDFGPAAEIDFDALRLAWYDHWLKGAATGILDGPPVRVFLMGPDRWLDLSDWPPPQAALQQVYLHSGTGGSAESLNTGLLAFAPPHADEESDSYTYDPVDPVPSLLRYPHTGPYDHRVLEGRMLTYSSPLIERDITVIGPVKVVLYAASSALDTDWVARLCDVHPDGRSMSVCDGILRARYRASFEQAEPLKPGQIYRFEVDLGATAQVFRAGHRLRLEITSSDFPRYDRNLNTGGVIAEEVQPRVAVNTIFHDASHPSHIGLPVIR